MTSIIKLTGYESTLFELPLQKAKLTQYHSKFRMKVVRKTLNTTL